MSLPAVIERHRFTSKDVQAMVAAGVLDDGSRVELIEGELIVPAAEGPVHAYLGTKLVGLLRRAYGAGFVVREGHPLVLSDVSEPQPDLVVARGTLDTFRDRHPTGLEAALVIEIAQTSLTLDRAKREAYARAGVPHYWILNIAAKTFEYQHGPDSGGVYAVTGRSNALTLPGLQLVLAVDQLL